MRIFPTVLKADFDRLPQELRHTHDAPLPARFAGRASVRRGRGVQAALVASLFRFPASAEDLPVTVTKYASQDGERWDRQFGKTCFRSFLRPEAGRMTERFGLFRFTLDLQVKDCALHYPVRSCRVLGLPLPRFLLPRSIATERVEDGRFTFDVQLIAPTGVLLIHYRGWLAHVPLLDPNG